MRITEATTIILILFFMGYLSFDNDLPGKGIIRHLGRPRLIYIHHISPVKYSTEMHNN